MSNILIVAAGGGLGAAMRYLAGQIIPIHSTGFPASTFLVNITGAFIIGFISGLSLKHNISNELKLFLTTGLCGGFTTFSTFSLETASLFSNGKILLASGYAITSVLLCVLGVLLGIITGKLLKA